MRFRGLILFAWIPALLVLLDCCLRPISEPDVFFYFAIVEKYLHSGQWPITDPFLYTLPNDKLMTLHQWLGYWIYYLPFQLVGWLGPILVMTAGVTAVFLVPLLPWRRDVRLIPAYFPLLWVMELVIAHHRFRERVSLFGDLFVVALVAGLLWWKRQRAFWIALPLAFLLWAQLHPSYPLGWVILGVFFLLDRSAWRRGPLLSFAFCLLTPIGNPLGLEGVIYPFRFALQVQPLLSQYVMEWLPLSDSRLFVFPYLYAAFVTIVPLLAWRLRRARPFEWFVFILAVALNFKSVRFGLMAQGLYLVLLSERELRDPWRAFAWSRAALAILTASLAVAAVQIWPSSHPSLHERLDVDASYFPVHAADELQRLHPRLPIFNSFGYGGYLAWRWGGDPPLFFHGFSTNFQFFADNYNQPQENAEQLDALIRRYDLGTFLIAKLGNDDNFITLLMRNPLWQKIYEDNAAVIFVKRDPRALAP